MCPSSTILLIFNLCGTLNLGFRVPLHLICFLSWRNKMYKLILLSLGILITTPLHADSDQWRPLGKNKWYLLIDGVGGTARVDVRITAAKKVKFLVSRPCPDTLPKRVDTLEWEVGELWGKGFNCAKEKVQLPTPTLWEELVGIPQKAQRVLDEKEGRWKHAA